MYPGLFNDKTHLTLLTFTIYSSITNQIRMRQSTTIVSNHNPLFRWPYGKSSYSCAVALILVFIISKRTILHELSIIIFIFKMPPPFILQARYSIVAAAFGSGLHTLDASLSNTLSYVSESLFQSADHGKPPAVYPLLQPFTYEIIQVDLCSFHQVLPTFQERISSF